MDAVWYHPVTQTLLVLITLAGLMALVALLMGRLSGWRLHAAGVAVAAMVAAALASMLIEEVLPLIDHAPAGRVAQVVLGMAGFLTGAGLLVWGASALGPGAAARRLTARRVWARALGRMLAAAVVFALSAALYHENRFPFTGLLD